MPPFNGLYDPLLGRGFKVHEQESVVAGNCQDRYRTRVKLNIKNTP